MFISAKTICLLYEKNNDILSLILDFLSTFVHRLSLRPLFNIYLSPVLAVDGRERVNRSRQPYF
jgi:hypothetical protein